MLHIVCIGNFIGGRREFVCTHFLYKREFFVVLQKIETNLKRSIYHGHNNVVTLHTAKSLQSYRSRVYQRKKTKLRRYHRVNAHQRHSVLFVLLSIRVTHGCICLQGRLLSRTICEYQYTNLVLDYFLLIIPSALYYNECEREYEIVLFIFSCLYLKASELRVAFQKAQIL